MKPSFSNPAPHNLKAAVSMGSAKMMPMIVKLSSSANMNVDVPAMILPIPAMCPP